MAGKTAQAAPAIRDDSKIIAPEGSIAECPQVAIGAEQVYTTPLRGAARARDATDATCERAMSAGNQTVIVTGAAGNLGSAVARAFERLRANLVLVDLRRDSLADRFGAERDRQLFLAADLLQPTDATRVATEAIARFGRIDVLCNIAGGFRMGTPVHETPDETWQFLFDLNVRSLLNTVRAVVPGMLAQGEGHIINVGAYAALKGAAGIGAYCASKAVVIRLTESMAAELRDKNINVNCVLPTTLDTPANRADMPDADPSRWVAPEDLAQTIVFLASSAARAIHGAALPVTGLS